MIERGRQREVGYLSPPDASVLAAALGERRVGCRLIARLELAGTFQVLSQKVERALLPLRIRLREHLIAMHSASSSHRAMPSLIALKAYRGRERRP